MFLAPRAKSQEKMNSAFCGTPWNLAERYTDMTKTLFVSLFYMALLPAGLFITATSFIITYWVDKYCLLRRWKTPPAYDDRLTQKSRGHVIFSIIMHLIMTGYFFAGWPQVNMLSVLHHAAVVVVVVVVVNSITVFIAEWQKYRRCARVHCVEEVVTSSLPAARAFHMRCSTY